MARFEPEIRVDPRFELIAVVHLLAEPAPPVATGSQDRPSAAVQTFQWNALDYSRAVRRRFRPHGRHLCLDAYRLAWREGLNADIALTLMHRSFEPRDLGFTGVIDTYYGYQTMAPLPRPVLKGLVDALGAFASDTGFLAFFAEQSASLRRYEDALRGEVRRGDPATLLAGYCGIEVPAPYILHLCPLYRGPSINYVLQEPSSPGGPRALQKAYSFLGPAGVGDHGSPYFGYDLMKRAVLQELAHTILDPLVDAHPDIVRGSERLLSQSFDSCRSPDWRSCVQTLLARGLARRVARGPQGGKGQTRWEPAEDRLTAAVTDRLGEFESDRDRYPSLKEFFPRWAGVLCELARQAPV